MTETEWMPAAIVSPPWGTAVEFTERHDDRVHVGCFEANGFRDRLSGHTSHHQDVSLWRYAPESSPA